MKPNPSGFSRLYRKALHLHLERSGPADLTTAIDLGKRALAAGITPHLLSKLHAEILVTEVLAGIPAAKRSAVVRKSGAFLASAVSTSANAESPRTQSRRLEKAIRGLSNHTAELAATNLMLAVEIKTREAAEASLLAKQLECEKSLEESERLRHELRGLSRRIISAQEDERKKISRDLHDIIAQTLIGINVRLATLKKEAYLNTKGLGRNISLTQRMVSKSANMVHQFARELRPAVLDDLGLIPALHSFMKAFNERTGVRTHLTAYAGIGKLDTTRSTVLFRVAQEALSNVGRHAKASSVNLHIQQCGDEIVMSIHDDGVSFDVAAAQMDREKKRLGLLGMRERVEMIDGSFHIDSTPGKGTTISARIPAGGAIKKLRPARKSPASKNKRP